jgi:hypothetical protein
MAVSDLTPSEFQIIITENTDEDNPVELVENDKLKWGNVISVYDGCTAYAESDVIIYNFTFVTLLTRVENVPYYLIDEEHILSKVSEA